MHNDNDSCLIGVTAQCLPLLQAPPGNHRPNTKEGHSGCTRGLADWGEVCGPYQPAHSRTTVRVSRREIVLHAQILS